MADYKIGDVDDTPNENHLQCQEVQPFDMPFICTRWVGHDGCHAAGTGNRIAAVWE